MLESDKVACLHLLLKALVEIDVVVVPWVELVPCELPFLANDLHSVVKALGCDGILVVALIRYRNPFPGTNGVR